jgi:hypothetical protein
LQGMVDATKTLVIAENEKLVLHDRTTGGAAELVLVERKRTVQRLEKAPPQQNLWVDSGSGSRPRL